MVKGKAKVTAKPKKGAASSSSPSVAAHAKKAVSVPVAPPKAKVKTTASKKKVPVSPPKYAESESGEEEEEKELEHQVEETRSSEDEGEIDEGTAAEKRIEQQLDDTITEMKEFKFMVRGMVNDWIERMQTAKREIRTLKRTQKRPRPANIARPKKPCVFEIPVPISDQMCDFLGLDRGTLMSRNDVTHGIHQYVVEHNLKDPENGRVIIPDQALSELIRGLPDDEDLSYLNLQRFIKHHY
jgi:chromatin remodeling complex protein RSC6